MSKSVEEINDLIRESMSQHPNQELLSDSELEWGNLGNPYSFKIQRFTQRIKEINIDLYSQEDYVEIVDAISYSIFYQDS